jgi:hypothetical protein
VRQDLAGISGRGAEIPVPRATRPTRVACMCNLVEDVSSLLATESRYFTASGSRLTAQPHRACRHAALLVARTNHCSTEPVRKVVLSVRLRPSTLAEVDNLAEAGRLDTIIT